jgi:hypothetical protein
MSCAGNKISSGNQINRNIYCRRISSARVKAQIIDNQSYFIPRRAIAQAVSRWLPTAVARVRARSGHVGFVVDKVALSQVFSGYFGFVCQSSFRQILDPHNHPGQVQSANWWPTCRVDLVGLQFND